MLTLKCETCGWATSKPQTSRAVQYRRGYYWHTPCAGEEAFPSQGKLIPETILHAGGTHAA